MHAPLGPSAGGWFGRWEDRDGTPGFVVEPTAPPSTLVLPDHGVAGTWHPVANAGITALAHAGGWTSLYAADRGVVRLTSRRSWWGLAGHRTTDVGARWLPGAVEWTARVGDATVRRRMAAHADGLPVLRVDVHLTGGGGRRWEERWVPEALPLLVGGLMSGFEPAPPDLDRRHRPAWWATYALSDVSRRLTWAARRLVGPWLFGAPRWQPADLALVTPATLPTSRRSAARPAWVDLRLPSLFVACLDLPDGAGVGAVGPSLVVDLPADDELEVSFAVGLAHDPGAVRRLVAAARSEPPEVHRRRWGSLVELEVADAPEAEVIAREARWHAAALVGAEQRDDHLGGRYVSQGSAYAYVHGLQGAPRDEAQFAVALTYLDPVAARSQLEVLLRMQHPSGSLLYAHTGRGRATSGGIHAAPTDLPLWLLWAVTEHVWATGDHRLLDTVVPWCPVDRARPATGREHLVRAARHLLDRVGTGPHGLLRVGSGDWADPISAMVPDRAAFHAHGESTFNTGFACHVLPRAATLLSDHHPDLADELRHTADDLATAMDGAWTGRWWLRGFDGRGGPIGADHLFVDGQVWAAIAGVGGDARRRRALDEVHQRCEAPSPIGATILDRPHEVRLGMLAPGWDCNGGVWAAIGGLLGWAHATVDPARGWDSLVRHSLAAHAAAYPHIWYGIWSGPDAYNAWFGSRPGETFVQPATPMRDFPVMNANAHAGPLLGLLGVLGIGTEPEGIVVRPRPGLGPWRLRTALGPLASG